MTILQEINIYDSTIDNIDLIVWYLSRRFHFIVKRKKFLKVFPSKNITVRPWDAKMQKADNAKDTSNSEKSS